MIRNCQWNMFSVLTYSMIQHALFPMSEGCTTPLLRPLGLLERITLHHAFLFWTNNASKPLTARSFFMHCNHVFLGWPLGLLPITIVLSTFGGHVSGSIHWTWPYQRRHLHLRASSIKPKPNQLLSSSDGTLSLSLAEHIILKQWLKLSRF